MTAFRCYYTFYDDNYNELHICDQPECVNGLIAYDTKWILHAEFAADDPLYRYRYMAADRGHMNWDFDIPIFRKDQIVGIRMIYSSTVSAEDIRYMIADAAAQGSDSFEACVPAQIDGVPATVGRIDITVTFVFDGDSAWVTSCRAELSNNAWQEWSTYWNVLKKQMV